MGLNLQEFGEIVPTTILGLIIPFLTHFGGGASICVGPLI